MALEDVDELELEVVFEVTALVLMTHGFVTPEAVKLTELPTLEAVMEVLRDGEVKILPLPAPVAVKLGAVNGRYISTSEYEGRRSMKDTMVGT